MKRLFGRRALYSNVREVTAVNVVDVIRSVAYDFGRNATEIDYLYKYYCGDQPVLRREKKIRPEICNKVVENRANEIVSFKVGYLCGEPVQYVARKQASDAIMRLNDMMVARNKPAKDKELVEWQMIAGTAYRMVVVDRDEDTPFDIYTLDPRKAFVIRSNRPGNKVLAGVYCGVDDDEEDIYCVYTPSMYFECKRGEVVRAEPHTLGRVPIIEYPANNARLGSFEIVISILDAINTVASNRIDGVEQFIQSLMIFYNCQLEDGTSPQDVRDYGAVFLKSNGQEKADLKILSEQLDQMQTQTLVDYMYQTVLTICGMPNRNGGSSTSDTGAATIMRDGWSNAEARAKDSELMFKAGETEMLKVVLHICRTLSGVNLEVSDIDVRFTRRHYENIESKAQVLCEMLNNDKIDPKLAFSHCGMFTDPEEAYKVSMAWYEQQQTEMEKRLMDVQTGGQSAEAP